MNTQREATPREMRLFVACIIALVGGFHWKWQSGLFLVENLTKGPGIPANRR